MTEPSSERPNIIWFFGDQLLYQALGFAGDPNVHTPSIDRLAAEGITSTAAVAGAPLCSPFRGSLITGRYPHHALPGHQYPLPDGQPTIGQAFQEAGYKTAYFGKWHLDGFKEESGKRAAMHIVPPQRRGGFDTWVGYENNNSQWDSWVHGGEGEDAFHFRLAGYEPDALADLFIQYLREDKTERPFFAVLSVQTPHNPYVAPPEWMERHTPGEIIYRANVPQIDWVRQRAGRDLAGYYAMIENLDWNLGRVRSALDELNLAHKTHILFFSDHGDMHGSHGQFFKVSPWEEAIRVPFIMGGHLPQYGHDQDFLPLLINHVDIAPTSLGLCGITPPEWMEGTDYSAYRLLKPEVPSYPDSAYLQIPIPTLHPDSVDRAWRGVVTRDGWKYVVLEGQPWLMFDLKADPYEWVNLAHNTGFERQRRLLHDRLRQWIDDTKDTFPLPRLDG
jgi:arylsulfatase A-like enzyme